MAQNLRPVARREPAGREANPEAVRIRLLGGFRVSVGDRVIREDGWRLRNAGSLVKLLALTPGHRLHRERVTDLLWPEARRRSGGGNLRHVLHAARRTLDPGPAAHCYLGLADGVLALSPGAQLHVDVEAFEEAAATARRSGRPAAYRAALDLYAGELLPGDLYEGWAESRREELRREFISVLIGLAEIYEAREDFGPAIEALRRVVAEERTNEAAHAALVRIYALSGRRMEALEQCVRFEEVLREIGAEPDAATRRLHAEILTRRTPDCPPAGATVEEPHASGPHNLPAARTSFVGREGELVEVKRLLAMTRLLTLTGTGGSGKTRLALEIAGDLAGAYPDGVWLVELAPLPSPELVPQAVAAALGVRERPGLSPTQSLAEYLRRKSLLLVLDNCEHLIDAVARLIGTLLDSCPRLRILATSREVLGVPGEVSWTVQPLSLPDRRGQVTVEDLAGCESARLFVERALHRPSAFTLTPENAPAVAEICRRLDGIPLAIELAAARVGAMTAGQISSRLADSPKLLTGGGRTSAPRQQTLKGALDWSYDLLGGPERRLFERLSVFVGGWTLETADAVAPGGGIHEDDVLDLTSHLVDKSLVAVESGVDGALRYRMLEPVRQYGRARLEESGESGPVQRRHAERFLALAEKAEPEMRGHRQAACLELLETEHDNLRAALSYWQELEDARSVLRMCGALGEFWYLRGYLSEGRRWLEAALRGGEMLPAPARGKALARAGWIAWEQGDYERSITLSEESLSLSREAQDTAGVAGALSTLGWAALFHDDLERASELTEEAMTLHRRLEDEANVARALVILGTVAVARGDLPRALALSRESLTLSRDTGDSLALILSLGVCALAHLGRGEDGPAKELNAEGLALSRRLRIMHVVAFHLHVSAMLAGSQALPARSARLWGAAEALRENIGTVLSPIESRVYGPYLDAARARLDAAEWDTAWAEGRALPLEQAVEYALSDEPPTPARHTTAADERAKLTPRQQEVAILIARGMTNRQISARLVVSERTVDAHVRKLLARLGLRSRVQIATWITEQRAGLRK